MKKIKIEIPETAWEAVYLGIAAIRNLRATGDWELSLEDATRRGIAVRPMTSDQMKSVLELNDVLQKLLENRFAE